MINEKSLEGTVTDSGTISGNVSSRNIMEGNVGVGGSLLQKAVLYTEQKLTDEEIKQARKNIRVIGESTTGKTFEPYTVDEANDYVYIYDAPVEAADGAEIFNDYENNIATGLWSTAMGCKTQSLGNYSIANGWWTRANGQCAVASGLLSIASGHFTHAEGTRTVASINNAHSEGDMTTASGRQSHAEGQKTVASGFCAHAEGSASKATNYYAHAEGLGTIAAGRNQTTMGKYNISDTSSLLIVGKGTGSKDSARSNAFKVSSKGEGWFAGAVTSAGADYAEYFEWLDGNPNGEDRIGLIVTLEGDKIRLANDGDDILGIVSGTAAVLGDNADCEWKNKFLTDSYGRYLTEEIEEFQEINDPITGETETISIGFSQHFIVNPEYDPTKEYVKRADRSEWDAIGLIGKIYVRDDGSCEVGGYAKVGANGIATKSSSRTNMRVLKRTDDNIVWCLVK